MAKSNLFQDLSNLEGKKQDQGYVAQLGIEHVKILIPLKEAKLFEKQLIAKVPSAKHELIEVVKSFNGLIDEGAKK